jgi:hypothetical protein
MHYKLALACINKVFKAMLYSTFPKQNPITIEDINADVFKEVVKSSCRNEVDIKISNVTQILYTAEKYDMEMLKRCCVEFIVRTKRMFLATFPVVWHTILL